MNMNDMAKKISEIEGKKVNLNIAQIKEVLGITINLFGTMSDAEIVKTVRKHAKSWEL